MLVRLCDEMDSKKKSGVVEMNIGYDLLVEHQIKNNISDCRQTPILQ